MHRNIERFYKKKKGEAYENDRGILHLQRKEEKILITDKNTVIDIRNTPILINEET